MRNKKMPEHFNFFIFERYVHVVLELSGYPTSGFMLGLGSHWTQIKTFLRYNRFIREAGHKLFDDDEIEIKREEDE